MLPSHVGGGVSMGYVRAAKLRGCRVSMGYVRAAKPIWVGK